MDIESKLKRLRREDLIWIIYFFIAAFALLSNSYDRDYLINHKRSAYKKERTINITIFIVAFFIYFYFVLLLTNDLSDMPKNFKSPQYRDTFIRLIAALLFLVGGAIYLYQEINYDETNEIGFI